MISDCERVGHSLALTYDWWKWWWPFKKRYVIRCWFCDLRIDDGNL